MEQIDENPLLISDESDLKRSNNTIKKKKYILMVMCVSIGLAVGLLIGYLTFSKKEKSSENDEVLKSTKSSNPSIKPNVITETSIAVEISVNFDINVDVNTLFDQIASGISRTAIKDSTFSDGSRFVSILEGNYVIAAYNHPTKQHSATAIGSPIGPTVRSEKPPGRWAISKVSAGICGRRTFYDSW